MFEDSICILCRNFFYGNLLTLDKKRTELSTRKDFVKLSESAKKYFVQGFKEYDKRGNPVYIYHPDIPRTYVREYEEKLFWNRLYIPDGELYLKRKNMITGSITKENANSGIMKAGKQAATANGNEMYNTNKFELRVKLNCQKLSMNILNQNSLSRYFT